jgi:hypothetical protein
LNPMTLHFYIDPCSTHLSLEQPLQVRKRCIFRESHKPWPLYMTVFCMIGKLTALLLEAIVKKSKALRYNLHHSLTHSDSRLLLSGKTLESYLTGYVLPWLCDVLVVSSMLGIVCFPLSEYE